MAAPAWFDSSAYFQNKLASMGSEWDSLALQKAFEDAGYNVRSADSLYAHFEQFGQYEGVSPSPLFNTSEYLYSKTVREAGTKEVTAQQVESMRLAIEGANLSPWEHYQKYGWQEGVNPSTGFDSSAYMQAKLEQWNTGGGNHTMAELEQAFVSSNLSALTHYFLYGQFEGVNYAPGSIGTGTPGVTRNLTTEDDSLYGTNGDDYFEARPGTLGDRDYLDGLGGNDTMYAYVGGDHNYDSNAGAITPFVTNIENVIFRAQRVSNIDGGSNSPSTIGTIAIDAGDITGMRYLGNDNSRAILRVEDVRTDSNQMTIAWIDSDAGANMNYEVYFNPQNIKREDGGETGQVRIELMDIKGAYDTGNVSPLLNNIYAKLTIKYTPSGGNPELVTLDLSEFAEKAEYTGTEATYETLVNAFNKAIAGKGLQNEIVASIGEKMHQTATTTLGGAVSGDGFIVNISTSMGKLEVGNDVPGTGWETVGIAPPESAYATNVGTSISACPLLQTNVHLDNVGRVQWHDVSDCLPDNNIYGEASGDMVIGSMANRGGIERFDVTVDRGSWLSSLQSTNEALRMVVVKGGDLNGDGITGNTLAEANKEGTSQLFIGRQIEGNPHFGSDPAMGSTEVIPTAAYSHYMFQWTDKAHLLSTDGLEDVKKFDATAFAGNVNLGASITATTFEKYLRDVDGTWSMDNLYAPSGNFEYDFGSNSDVLNMSVNSAVAADKDFNLVVNMGDGKDFINFAFENEDKDGNWLVPTHNQIQNSNHLHNVILNGQSGNDTIKVWGRTAVTANGGSGDDIIFVSQANAQNAVFVFNTADQYDRGIINTNQGAQSLYNDILSTSDNVTYAGATSGQEVVVKVGFMGMSVITQTVYTHSVDGATGRISTAEINKAIIKAINEDAKLSELLVAKDGAGNSLIVESLINGNIDLAALTVTFHDKNAKDFNQINLANNYYKTEYATNGTGQERDLDIPADAIDVVTQDGDEAAPIPTYAEFNANLNKVLYQVAPGESVRISIDNVDYIASNPTGGATITDEAGLINLLQSAYTVDASGNYSSLGSKWTITDGSEATGTTTDGIIRFVARDYATSAPATIDVYDNYVANTPVTGWDYPTASLNRVNGGTGDDVIVLGAGSGTVTDFTTYTEYNRHDVVVIDGAFGNDIVVNFQSGADKIGVGSLLTSKGVVHDLGKQSSGDNNIFDLKELAGFMNSSSSNPTTNVGEANSVAFVQDNKTGVYTFFQIQNDSNPTVAESEITVLGTISFANEGNYYGSFDLAAGDVGRF